MVWEVKLMRYIIIIPQEDGNKIELLDGTKKQLDERIKTIWNLYHTIPIWSQTGVNKKGRKQK